VTSWSKIAALSWKAVRASSTMTAEQKAQLVLGATPDLHGLVSAQYQLIF